MTTTEQAIQILSQEPGWSANSIESVTALYARYDSSLKHKKRYNHLDEDGELYKEMCYLLERKLIELSMNHAGYYFDKSWNKWSKRL